LLHNEGYPRFCKGLRFLELVIELSSSADLENDIDIKSVVEAAIQFNDIGMVEEHLDLNLPNELISDLLLVQQFLLYYLQRANKVGVALTHQINPSILPISELFQSREIFHAHFPCFPLPDWKLGNFMFEAGIDY
jgi:hypothetical protein